MLLYFIVLSIALSIDALGIGITYRINGVTIPTKSKAMIGFVTMIIMLIAIMTGKLIHEELPYKIAEALGAIILVIIGLIFIYQSMTQKKEAVYDIDHSRKIEPLEGILLAIALSTDSIGAGIALASTGISRFYLAFLVGGFQLIFLFLADFCVQRIPCIRTFNQKICGIISGLLLVIVGFMRFF